MRPLLAKSSIPVALAALAFLTLANSGRGLQASENQASPVALEVVARINEPLGNLTVAPDGRIIVSLHQHFNPALRVGEVVDGRELKPFPNAAWNDQNQPDAERLDSVLGIQVDREGVVWMLDNGMRAKITPKLVGWDLKNDRLFKVIELPAPVTRPDSFLNDLAVDRDHGKIYIADPTRGDKPALIVVDIESGEARRVLEGHRSVMPEDIDLVIDQRPVQIRRPDGSTFRPRVGVNPIALDAENQWLYYGPMHGTAMYRVSTKDLIDSKLSGEQLDERVERVGNKPISDGSTVNQAGEVYVSDIGNHAIGRIDASGTYSQIIQDRELLQWPDSFSFGPDNWCYVLINQLHRGPVLNAGTDETKPPYIIVRFRDQAGGVIGR